MATACTDTIGTSVSPAGTGTASGAGTYNCNSSVTVTASPASGYNFANWTINGVVVSSSPSYTFTATANQTCVANFTPVPCNDTISTSISPAGSGTASGAGTYTCNSGVTVTASPASGYNFANWTVNGSVVSTSTSYTFTATGNQTLVANFTAVPCTDTITTSASPAGAGTTSGGGTVSCNSSVTVTTSPTSGYTFANWTVNGTVVSTSASYTFTATANQTCVANFTCVDTITTSVSPAGAGTASGGGTVGCNSSVTVTASPASGYTFANWTVNGTVVSTSASYTFSATASQTCVANFTAIPCSFTLSSSSASFGAVSTNGSATVTASSGTCTWSATSGAAWLHTSSSATGSGTASYSVDANTSAGSRSGSLTIAGQTFTVNQSGHTPPVANAGANQTASVGTTLTFSGSGSIAKDGSTMSSYSWAFGDLGTGSGVSVNHAYASAGTYAVTLTVTDSWGATGSGNCTINVTNVPCALNPALTAPGNGATVSNTIALTATASTCAARVEFYCDSTVLVGTATTAPYSVSWDTTAAANGLHNLAAKAYDAAGNSMSSASSTVTVSNLISDPGPWVRALGGLGDDSGLATATDSSGNIIVAGYFSGSVSFGSGTLTSAGGTDIFVAKYSPAGANLWAKSFGGTGDDRANGVAVDASGNIFITGQFSTTVNFGQGALTCAGGLDIFVAKLSPAGVGLWSKRYGSTSEDIGSALAVDGSGNVVVTGHFMGTNNFGGGTVISTFSGMGSLTTMDTFVLKLAGLDGSYQWLKTFSNDSQNRAFGVAVDLSGNVLVTGSFEGNIDLIGGWTSYLTSAGAYDIFVAKLSGSNGSHVWSKRIGGTDSEEGFGVAADPRNGDVLVTGYFRGSVDFGAGAVNSAGSDDIFVAKFSGSSGAYVWSQKFGSYDGDRGYGIAVDANGNAVVTGVFSDTVNFGGTALTSSGTTGGQYGSFDAFIAKYSAGGVYQWSERYGGLSNDMGRGVAVDPAGKTVGTGSFQGSADFRGQTLTSAGSGDGFLLRLDQ
jgi:hypothetical protein